MPTLATITTIIKVITIRRTALSAGMSVLSQPSKQQLPPEVSSDNELGKLTQSYTEQMNSCLHKQLRTDMNEQLHTEREN